MVSQHSPCSEVNWFSDVVVGAPKLRFVAPHTYRYLDGLSITDVLDRIDPSLPSLRPLINAVPPVSPTASSKQHPAIRFVYSLSSAPLVDWTVDRSIDAGHECSDAFLHLFGRWLNLGLVASLTRSL